MLMITFRTAYLPSEDADLDKFDEEETLTECNTPPEVEYDPSKALSLDDSNVEEPHGFVEHTWKFASSVVIAVFGMLVITVRSAYVLAEETWTSLTQRKLLKNESSSPKSSMVHPQSSY